MSLVTSLRSTSSSEDQPQKLHSFPGRWIGAGVLLLCSIILTVWLRVIAPPIDTPQNSFLLLWLLSFIPYLLACVLIVVTRAPSGRWRLVESGVILLGGLILRLTVLPLFPNLSHDSWRYLWDARVTLHGFSPYAYPPRSPQLMFLRNIIYDNSRYRDVPTLYPPGAQAIYLLSYILSPDNLIMFKGILIVCDLITCIALAWWLKCRGMDPALCLIYAWCPLPVVEFALNGHHEAIAVLFMALAFVCNQATWRGSRVATGFFIAMATLTNIYPVLMLVVMVRRRDWALLLTFVLTCILAYLPYIILGHGQIFGFFSTYASEQAPNAGVVPLFMRLLGQDFHWSGNFTLYAGYVVDLILVGCVALLIVWLRWRKTITPEVGVLALIGIVFSVSTHIYPWYDAELLPWIALLLAPLWTRARGWNLRTIAAILILYFCIASIAWYYFFFSAARDWNPYYQIAYAAPLIGLLLIAAIASWRKFRSGRSEKTLA